ncbi:MAG: phenylacetate--CoA ligase family protein [Candidatus Woesearchaeota archaeon]
MEINKYLRLLTLSKLSKAEILNWYKTIKENETLTKTEIAEYQFEKLKIILHHSYENVPYYTKLFNKLDLKPDDITSVNDLKLIPPLTKEIMRNNFELLKPQNLNKISYQNRSTGGTTGVPHKYYSDMNSWALHWALKLRAFEEADYLLGEKMAIMAGASLVPEQKAGLKRKVWNQLQGFVPLSMTSFSQNDLKNYYDILIRKRIKYLRGYPTAILQFAEFIRAHDLKIHIKAVFTTAEVLQPEHRRIIERTFECKIFDQYGCADGGGHAFECKEHNGLHWAFEASVLESEKTENAQIGEEVLLTNLTNLAMPVIRYMPGDLIVRQREQCSCGKQTAMLKEIIGRTTEIIKFTNGKALSGPAFTLIFRKFNLEQYQLVQNTPDSIDINIVPNNGFKSEDKSKIIDIMKFHCGEEIDVNINQMSAIAPAKSGKFRFIISNL